MADFENWGDYFWPGQLDECLRNKAGITDPDQLRAFERDKAFSRSIQLLEEPDLVPKTFDLAHLQAIHAHVFGDVYEWAGQLRVTELVRPSSNPNEPGHEFMKPELIETVAPYVFGQADVERLASADRVDQVEQLAWLYNGLNMLHPFVEGNGRTNRLFLGDVAAAAGLSIDWSEMPDQNAIMADGPGPPRDALAACLSDATDPTAPAADQARASVLDVAPTTDPASQSDLELREDVRRMRAMNFPSSTAARKRAELAVGFTLRVTH